MSEKLNLDTSERLVFEQILDAIPAGVTVIDQDFNIHKVNQWMRDNFADLRPLVGKKCYEVTHQCQKHHPNCPSARAKKSGQVESAVFQININKAPKWVAVTSFPLKGEKGHIYGFIEYLIDITGKKRDERLQQVVLDISKAAHSTVDTVDLIREIREILSAVIDTTNFFVALYDKENNTLDLPFFVDERDHFTSFPAGKTLTIQVIRRGKPLLLKEEEMAKMASDGIVEQFGSPSKVWLGVPLRVQDEIVGVLAVQSYKNRDAFDERDLHILEFVSEQIAVTIERKKTERELRQSEVQHRTTLNSMQDAVHVIDRDFRIVLVNESLLQFNQKLGISGDIVGQKYFKVYPFLSLNVRHEYEHVFATGDVTKTVEKNTFGDKIIYTETKKIPIFDKKHVTQVLTVIKDTTQQHYRDVELARLAAAVDQTRDSIVIISKDTKIEYVNPAFEQISGTPKETLIGLDAAELKNELYDEKFYSEIENTIFQGQTWSGHIIMPRSNDSPCELDVVLSPVFNKNGQLENFVAVARDVTSEIKMQKQLVQAQKMEAIGTLAGGIAHDFNNILASIIGFTQLSQMQVSPGSKLERNSQNILKACDRARELTQHILLYSRGDDQEQQILQFAAVAKESIKLLKASLPSTITITADIRNDVGLIRGNATQIHQILMNLATNAAHAMTAQIGHLEISAQEKDVCQRNSQFLKSGKYIELVVSDTGHGIEKKFQDRIFDPFFTTKPSNVGTGLGLSVVHGIIKSMGGQISVKSQPDHGATFTILLPKIDSSEKLDQHSANSDLQNGSETILFIDDEEDLVKINEEMLAHLGYNVVATTSSTKGLALFKEKPQKFNLIITDQTMPDMTGDALARQMRAIAPDIPIMLCTGYNESILDTDRPAFVDKVLRKPVYIEELAVVIRELLEKGRNK